MQRYHFNTPRKIVLISEWLISFCSSLWWSPQESFFCNSGRKHVLQIRRRKEMLQSQGKLMWSRCAKRAWFSSCVSFRKKSYSCRSAPLQHRLSILQLFSDSLKSRSSLQTKTFPFVKMLRWHFKEETVISLKLDFPPLPRFTQTAALHHFLLTSATNICHIICC